MVTISNILEDIDRGCAANNMVEDCFSYRIIFFVNDENKSFKHYADTAYDGLRDTLEEIVRKYLTLTNTIVIAETTVLKNGSCVRLLSRSYPFSLSEYFRQINGDCGGSGRRGNIIYGRYAAR